jgi:hypothetical protein
VNWTHRCMIVPAAYAPLAQALASGLAGEAGANMWTTPLSATGQMPASHHISTGLIQEEFAALMADADAVYAAAGGTVPLADIQALLAASDIAEAEPHARMAELGLKMIQEAA